jgi:hypothetical protein
MKGAVRSCFKNPLFEVNILLSEKNESKNKEKKMESQRE